MSNSRRSQAIKTKAARITPGGFIKRGNRFAYRVAIMTHLTALIVAPVSRRAVRAVVAVMVHPLLAFPVAVAVPVAVAMPADHDGRAARRDDDFRVRGGAGERDTQGDERRGDQIALFHGLLLLETWIKGGRRVEFPRLPRFRLRCPAAVTARNPVWRSGGLIDVWICNLGFFEMANHQAPFDGRMARAEAAGLHDRPGAGRVDAC